MYDFNDQFTHYSRLDHLDMAYYYAELVLIDLYNSIIADETSTYFNQRWYNRMVLNAALAKI